MANTADENNEDAPEARDARWPDDEFLIWGRDVQKAFRTGAKGDGRNSPEYLRRLPLLAQELASLYLIGSFAYLEGQSQPCAWKGTGVDEERFEQFLCIRNALTHNKGDLAKNRDSSCLGRLADIAAIPGVQVNGTTVSLDLDFTEQVRQSFLRLSKHLQLW